MIIDNSWYGHRRELLRYVGQKDFPVFAFIAHSSSLLWEFSTFRFYGKFSRLYPLLVWTEQEEISMRSLGVKRIESIGAPFLYAYENVKNSLTLEKSGTFVIPQHLSPGYGISSESIQSIMRLVRYAELHCEPPFFMSLPEFDPRYKHFVMQSLGDQWSFFNAGTRNNPLFLENLIRKLASVRSVVAETSSSTAYYYSLFLGAEVRLLDDRSILESNVCYPYCKQRKIRPEIEHLVGKHKLTASESKLVAGVILGTARVRTREDLARNLGVERKLGKGLASLVFCFQRLRYGREAFDGVNDFSINKKRKTQNR